MTFFSNQLTPLPTLRRSYTFFLTDLRNAHIGSLTYRPAITAGGILYVFPNHSSAPYQVHLGLSLDSNLEQECSSKNLAINVSWPKFFRLRRLFFRAYESAARRFLAPAVAVFLFFACFMCFSSNLPETDVKISISNKILGLDNDPVLKETFKNTAPPKVKFKDVIGLDQGKKELIEIVDFIKHPEKYKRVGASIPLGVLLTGEPGTGKTLLAKAFAGEANIPFFSISGASFDEVFVGIGAERVKALFAHARKHAPCAIFIDEIDSIGGSRDDSFGTSGQTLTQLLSEMDGFLSKEQIIVFAATNRPHILDPALKRPGRFDRIVATNLPNGHDREKILQHYIHKKRIPLAPEVDLKLWVRRSAFMSPADLESFLNDAGLFAVRTGHNAVSPEDFEQAFIRLKQGHRPDNNVSPSFRKKKALLTAAETIVAWDSFKNQQMSPPIYSSIFSEKSTSSLGVLLEPMNMDEEGLTSAKHFKNSLKLYSTESVISGRYRDFPAKFFKEETPEKFSFSNAILWARYIVLRQLGGGLIPEFGDTLPELLSIHPQDRPYVFSALPETTREKIEAQTSALLEEAQKSVFDLLLKKREVLFALQELLLEKETLNAQELKDFFSAFEF